MTIWKFTLRLVDRQTVMMPRGAKIIAVQEQAGAICLWAIVDPQENKTSRLFTIAGTGHQLPPNAAAINHLGTVQLGAYVWHVFEG